MWLGDYLAAQRGGEYYATEREAEQREVNTIPEGEVAESDGTFV
jgi:hypothetical protein